MPTVSRFFGIVVFLNYRDHAPPHFHARYGEDEVIVEIRGGAVTGKMSKRALRLVLEWASLHEDDLMRNWDLARASEPLEQIEPLT
ncbi:DUF4160 domain-containing protein [Rubrivirga sp.]|uniref:DUF4160 domain-containing protein n=1 Tax=Rubrivirga sp. TaxID=1885344 RepID=UPI003C77ED75